MFRFAQHDSVWDLASRSIASADVIPRQPVIDCPFALTISGADDTLIYVDDNDPDFLRMPLIELHQLHRSRMD
jgi:hypothetical protein